jgi:hypothetical protein
LTSRRFAFLATFFIWLHPDHFAQNMDLLPYKKFRATPGTAGKTRKVQLFEKHA